MLKKLLPSLTSLAILLAVKLVLEFAPLPSKLDLWASDGLFVLAVFVILGMIRRAALLGMEWSAQKAHPSATLQQGFIPLMRNIITLFVFLTGGIMVLKHFNYDVMSLITALGVGSLAVGLAAKDTLSNMISGFTLIIDRNMRPGDRINLGGLVGDVDEIGLRSTRLRTADGHTLIVPNAEMVNTKILNLSMPTRASACHTTIRVPLDVEFAKVREVCMKAMSQTEKADSRRPHSVELSSVTDGNQFISIRFWLKDFEEESAALTQFHELLLKEKGSLSIR